MEYKTTEKHRASDKKRYYANPEKNNAASKEWREAHPEISKARSRDWAKAHPERMRESSRKNAAKTREIRRSLLNAMKSKPCMDCKGVYPPYIMDFDHRPNEIKEFNIGQKFASRSLESLMNEIAKCDVVCSNCHRERTYQRSLVAVI